MIPTSRESASDREILLVGPYGVLGTGVIEAVAANPARRVTTAARRPAPTYRTQTPPRHISVDLMDREGTIKAFSNLDTVTDLVYAAYVEKPTMAETVAPNARMLTNTLEALAARNVPLRRIVLAGGAKSYRFSLGAFNAPAKETEPRLIAPVHYHQQEDIVGEWSSKHGASWTVLRPHLVMGPSLNSPMNLVTSLAAYAAMSRELGLPLRFPGRREGRVTELIDLAVHGYDDDPRGLSEIPEVRRYIQGLDADFPYWLYFLSKRRSSLMAILSCMVPVSRTPDGRLIPDHEGLGLHLMQRGFPAMNQVCSFVNCSEQEIERMTNRVLSYLQHGPTDH
jgi:nucleoside-diphosphate-sugar epimerase